MGCRIKDNAKADPEGYGKREDISDMCKGDCESCPHYYPELEIDDGMGRLINILRHHKVKCRRTSNPSSWPDTFHIGYDGQVYHLSFRKVTEDMDEEIERGMF